MFVWRIHRITCAASVFAAAIGAIAHAVTKINAVIADRVARNCVCKRREDC